MKLAVSSTGQNMDSMVSPVFGRCPFFMIVETSDNNIKGSNVLKNQAMNQRGGAGIMAAQDVANQDVNVVISGAVGPRAFSVLQKLGIKIYVAKEGTIKQNVEMFLNGNLQEIKKPGPMGKGMGGGMGRGRGGSEVGRRQGGRRKGT